MCDDISVAFWPGSQQRKYMMSLQYCLHLVTTPVCLLLRKDDKIAQKINLG